MNTLFRNPVSPYPGWKRRIYRLSRPVTDDDIKAFLGDQDLYVRETESGLINIIHKFGILEIHFIVNDPEVEVWYDPEAGSYPLEYLEALLTTRF
ncbi:MAG TPA: hypothetical protein VMC42_02865 [Methanoregulaceae archaeon]|nr:hypothetical protein [Methanoregulaceae archaeon]